MQLPNDILALQQAPGLSENDAASIDHLPGLKSLKMRVRHWGTAPYIFLPRYEYLKLITTNHRIGQVEAEFM